MSNTDFNNDLPTTSDYATWVANPGAYNFKADNNNQLPIQPQPVATGDVPVSNTNVLDQLFGTNGVDRYQTWPEKLVREAVSAPHDVMTGDIPVALGSTEVTPQEMNAASSMASLAGTGGLVEQPGAATLGSALIQPASKEAVPVFYSAVENAVNNAKIDNAPVSQWLGYLKNQPGVKQEELDWTLGELPQDQKLTKPEMQEYVNANKVQLGEVNKGKVELPVEQDEDEPNIYNIYHATDPTGEREGMWGQIIKDTNGYRLNVPELPRKTFDTLDAAKDFVSDKSNIGSTAGFPQYQLPGGSNYREKILILPEKKIPDDVRFMHQFPDILDKTNGIQNIDEVKLARSFNPQFKETFKNLSDQQVMDVIKKAKATSPYELPFTTVHWDDINNPLAHVRMNDRSVPTDAFTVRNKQSGNNGPVFDTKEQAQAYQNTLPKNLKTEIISAQKLNKTLHLEEIQSDWHQQGRQRGYKLTPAQEKQFQALDDKIVNSGDEDVMGDPDIKSAIGKAVDKKILTPEEGRQYLQSYKGADSPQAVPNAPFKQTWPDLVLKKMIRHAADNGYDAISWTPGEAQAARYDLSKQVDNIGWNKQTQGKDSIVRIDVKEGKNIALQVNKDGNIIESHPRSQAGQFEGKHLSDVVGKDLAQKILDKEEGNLSGEGLKIGGEGMKAFYNKMLVDKANTLAKKYGGKVEEKNLKPDNNNYQVVPFKNGYDIRFKNNMGNEVFNAHYPTLKEAQQRADFLNNVPGEPIHFLRLPQSLKDVAQRKGFPLFSSGLMLQPVIGNPHQDKTWLKPVVGNPFE